MPTHVEGSFEVTSWAEEDAEGLGGAARVTTARIGQRFTGGIEADTVADMVMTYGEDGTAEFVGYHRVEGTVGERTGSFVLRASGGFDGTEARTEFTVVGGSGRGDLAGVTGAGVGAAGVGPAGKYTFDLDL